jgi:hypothetical protein
LPLVDEKEWRILWIAPAFTYCHRLVAELMPPPSAKHRSAARWSSLLAVVCLAVCWSAGPVHAQPQVHYFSGRTFEIPFEMGPIGSVKQVVLHASTDGKTWAPVSTTSGRNSSFTYTAEKDGWYYFIVQLEMMDGRKIPGNVQLAPPGLRVCVDTVKPVVKLRAVAPQQGETVGVEWELIDANLDLRTLRVSYSIAGAERWIPLNIRPLPHAQFSWSPIGPGPFEVRVSVSDMAGNIGSASTTVSPGAPAAPAAAGYSASTGQAPRVIHVRSKTFKLNYKTDNVGPSNVKGVEVWITRDTTAWRKYRADANAPANGPYEVTVESSGRWGFTLRPISGVGRASNPPSVHQQPQIWVEVDDQPPQVLLHNVIVGDGADNGFIIVNWRATDRWLRAKPITIKYAKSKEGPWETLEANVENTGSHRCSIKGLPPDLYEFFVRVEATDEAGNTAGSHTNDTVKVDLKVPVVPSIEVEAPTADSGAKPGG